VGTVLLAVGGVLGISVPGMSSIFLGIVLFIVAFWTISRNRWPVRKRRFASAVALVIAACGSVWIHQHYSARPHQSSDPGQSNTVIGDQNQIINGNSGSISINNQKGNKAEAKK
jgi:4-amino-4-deoxy-L-arabinose transferase-like glycosyltransferase